MDFSIVTTTQVISRWKAINCKNKKDSHEQNLKYKNKGKSTKAHNTKFLKPFSTFSITLQECFQLLTLGSHSIMSFNRCSFLLTLMWAILNWTVLASFTSLWDDFCQEAPLGVPHSPSEPQRFQSGCSSSLSATEPHGKCRWLLSSVPGTPGTLERIVCAS